MLLLDFFFFLLNLIYCMTTKTCTLQHLYLFKFKLEMHIMVKDFQTPVLASHCLASYTL